jgi:cobaltochelatase CobN
LQEKFKTNAVVHFGTHGSEFFLPGKPNGLSKRDWPDIIMGRMPNFNPWIIENMVESSPVRRRTYGVLIDHLSPPIVNAGLSDELANLAEMLEKWEVLEEGALKEKFVTEITKQVRSCRLDVDLKLTTPISGKLEPDAIQKVSKYLHDIQDETTPISLHTMGQPPRKDLLPAYMVNILRKPFLDALEPLLPTVVGQAKKKDNRQYVRSQAEKLLQLVLLKSVPSKDAVETVAGKAIPKLPEEIERGLKLAVHLNADFAKTTDEIDNLLKGLDGRFVPPGPGNNPIRNPSAVPTGRNMYLLNPEEVPTRPSWELGKKLAEELIARHQEEHKSFPTKVGFDLRSSATFRDYGVMEGQILTLIGVEPVWDERNLVNDVKLISREKLGRPRIDVFIAAGGWYESNLPSRLNLWDKAIRLAAAADEPDNPIGQNTRELKKILRSKGVAAARADLLAPGRIFGIAPGRESTGLRTAVERSGDWNTREDIASRYLASHNFVYTEGAWGEQTPELYESAIQGTHTVVRSWSDHMTGPLASKYTWLHGGALCLAVEKMTGKRPDYVFSDVRDPDKAGMVRAEDALRKEYRVRLFNRKWLEGMMKEGYAGADNVRVMVSNSVGWETMRPGSVGDDTWLEMKNVIVDDKLNLSIRDWYERNNPNAFQDTTAVILEAIRKGFWKADAKTKQQLAVEYAKSVARHGLSGHITSGGNAALDGLVRGEIGSLGGEEGKKLLAKYTSRIAEQKEIAAVDVAPGTSPAPAAASAPATAPAGQPATVQEASPDGTKESESAKPPTAEAKTTPLPTAKAQEAKSAQVQGKRLEPTPQSSDKGQESADCRVWLWITAGIIIILFVLGGYWLRKGTP